MWVAQEYLFNGQNQLLSSGGLGTMGYSLPASIGAQIGNPKKQVWAIMGDGGFQMNMQELGTIMEQKLPVKIIILNNGYLGMVRQWQELFFNKNYSATSLQNPDFVKIAQGYSIEAHKIEDQQEMNDKISQASKSPQSVLLEFIIGSEDKVLPMVPVGKHLNEVLIKT